MLTQTFTIYTIYTNIFQVLRKATKVIKRNFTLPEAVAEKLDNLVEHRKRSAFVAEAIAHKN